MKYVFYAFLIIPQLWGTAVNGALGLFSSLLITTYGSIFWLVAWLYIYDFCMAIAGRNSKYMSEFYYPLKNDFLVNIVFALTLVFLLWLAPNAYSFLNIDIAAAGLPFLIYALIDTQKISTMKVADRKLPRRITAALLGVQTIAYASAVWSLKYVLDGKASPAQSIWIQITIVSAALTFFFGAKQSRYILTKQRMEVSPVLINLFRSIPSSRGILNEAEIVAGIWNTEIKKVNAIKRKDKTRRRKKK